MNPESLPKPSADAGKAEVMKEDLKEYYAHEIREVIGDRKVYFENPESFNSDKDRFLFGLTRSNVAGDPDGFVKMCTIGTSERGSDALNERLRREANAATIAAELGVPTVPILHPYQEIRGEYALIHLQAFNGEAGGALNSYEDIAGANPAMAKWVAELLIAHAAHEIPATVDTSQLKKTDERNASEEIFWHTWESDNAIIESFLSGDTLGQWRELVARTRSEIGPIIAAAASTDKEYFVHNDLAPGNIFFDESVEKVVPLDFEHAGAVHNQALAWISEVGTFYGRCWPNPEMQRAFLKPFIEKASIASLDEVYTKLKAAVVASTMFFAKFAVDPSHPEHLMTTSLLNNAEENIRFLDALYQKKKDTLK